MNATKTKVKICGITNVEDAQIAHSLGADFLGLIFVDSPRRIDAARAKEIREALPGAMLVGVFQDTPVKRVVDTVREAELNFIQLHGDESPEYCDELSSQTNVPIIKAFNSSGIPDTELLSQYQTTSFFLFDLDKDLLADEHLHDKMDRMWQEVSKTRRQGFRVFLAGALDENNVRAAVEHTDAYCVDVCRGVESEPGIKDARSIERFIREAKA